MDGWMDGYGWMDEWMDEYGWMNGWMDEWMNYSLTYSHVC
jgi:hypothetical protein